MSTSRLRPASQKQFDFIKSLISQKELDNEGLEFVAKARAKAVDGKLVATEASDLIEYLMAQPAKLNNETSVATGVYQDSRGRFFRVYLGQQSGVMLVKAIIAGQDLRGAWTDVSYDYLGAASKHLPEDATRLPLEEVGRLGMAVGECLICGRRLDDPESVDRGIGPVCASKY